MSVSIRSHVTAAVSVVTSGIIAVALVVTPPSPDAVRGTPRVDLASSARPLVIAPPSPQKFAAAVAAIERVDPTARQTARQDVAPVPLNAASDLIVSGYQFIQFWVNYGVQLTDYVLGFIPYGYLIADQINIFYYNLIRPIADSVVYDLVVPVVNQPLNPASYVNGLIAVGQETINAAINTGITEFNYFFGWLIPPLPFTAAAVTPASVFEDPSTTSETAPLDPSAAAVEPPTEPALRKEPDLAAETATTTPLRVEDEVEVPKTEPTTTEVRRNEATTTEPTTRDEEPMDSESTDTEATEKDTDKNADTDQDTDADKADDTQKDKDTESNATSPDQDGGAEQS